MFLLLPAIFDISFYKDFATFLWSNKTQSCLHTLVIREHSSGSVVSSMALYYAQYKHTKLGWSSCLGIN